MASFEKAYSLVAGYEGQWCDVPGDRGGETYKGIARAFFGSWSGWATIDNAKKHGAYKAGPAEFSRHLEKIVSLREAVEAWYRKEWWDRLGLGRLPSQSLANEVFEQAVNLGMGGAGKLVQKMCNAFNRARDGSPLFPDLEIDGAVGPKTLDALGVLLAANQDNEELMVRALNCLQGAHYVDLACRRPVQRKFIRGWLRRTL